jgi:predicted metal-dependent peptidase
MFMPTQLTPDQRVQKAVIDIMANPKYTALAGVLMIGSRRVEQDASKCPTAHTNGVNVVFGADFIEALNDAELRFLVLHEEYHKLYKHLTTWAHLWKQNPQLANMACDYVINCKLVDDNADGFATMTGALRIGCLDTKYRNWDSAQVFNDLLQNPPPSGGGGDGSGSGSGEGFDDHDWEAAEEMTPEERNAVARDLDEAIRQGALMAGKTGSGGDRDLTDLLTPQVNWREVLRDFITTTCAGRDFSTWRKPNRRYIGAGIYMPSGISEQIGEIVVAIDTSGSIGARELSVFLSEIKSVADTVHPEAIRVLYWDTAVCGDERYEGDDTARIIESTKPVGGGGTDVRCVPEYIQAKQINAQAVIVLTDGHLYGGWGSWQHPVLWAVLDNKGASPSIGKTVHMQSRDI